MYEMCHYVRTSLALPLDNTIAIYLLQGLSAMQKSTIINMESSAYSAGFSMLAPTPLAAVFYITV